MPFIRVNCPKGALTAEQKAMLAPKLVRALIRQEIDPVTESGTAKTGFMFNEIDVENCFPGGVPLMQLHVVFVEIPEGSWGAGGQTIGTETIGKLHGATEGPTRFAEALELGAKMKAARLS